MHPGTPLSIRPVRILTMAAAVGISAAVLAAQPARVQFSDVTAA